MSRFLLAETPTREDSAIPDSLRSRLPLAAACMALLMVSCGSNAPIGRTGSGGTGASSSGGGGAAATGGAGGSAGATESKTARNPSCPSTVPTQGGSCKPILTCGYPGSAAHGLCSIVADCGGSEMSPNKFMWYVSQPSGCGVNAATCPASFSALAPGSPCPGARSLFCSYPEGACGCVPCAVDGGAPTMSMWACRAWGPDQSGCPPDPPLAGDACTASTPECSYGVPCVFAVGSSMICNNGYWQQAAGGDCIIPMCGPR
jgi:hypothetical protein